MIKLLVVTKRKKLKNSLHSVAAVLFTFILFLNQIHGQGNTTFVEGHHLAGVNITNTTNTILPLKYKIDNRYAVLNIPGYNIPYSNGNIVMRGIMTEAALAVDWWSLFGEPAEQYIFTWGAGDYYELVVPAAEGGSSIVKKISKSELRKYPDLLLRYEAIKPTDVSFQIEWSFTLTDGEVLDKTGYSFQTYYGTGNKFTTHISSATILTEPSGKIPFAVPGIRQGKGNKFLNLPDNFPEEKIKELMQVFVKSKQFYISKVEIIDIKWPVNEMLTIAELFEKYEKGEATPSPTQIVNTEINKHQNITTYNNNDFWGDAYEESNTNLIGFDENGKVGFKNEKGKIEIPPIYKWASFISKHKIIIGQEFDKDPGLYSTKGALKLNLKDYRDSKILDETDYILIFTYTTGYYVNLKNAEIVFNIPLHGGNYTNSKRKFIPVNKYNYETYQSKEKYDDVSPTLVDMTSQGILPRTVYYVMGDYIMKNSGGWTVRKVHFYGVTTSQEIKLFFTGKLRFGF